MAGRPIPTLETVKKKYQEAEDWLERPHNVVKILGRRPDILKTFEPLQRAILAPAALETRTKVLAYLAASYLNESPASVRRFRETANQAKVSESELSAIKAERDSGFTPLERAALKVSRDLTRTCTIEDLEANELDLFTHDQFIELVSVVSLANFENRFANAIDITDDQADNDPDAVEGKHAGGPV